MLYSYLTSLAIIIEIRKLNIILLALQTSNQNMIFFYLQIYVKFHEKCDSTIGVKSFLKEISEFVS